MNGPPTLNPGCVETLVIASSCLMKGRPIGCVVQLGPQIRWQNYHRLTRTCAIGIAFQQKHRVSNHNVFQTIIFASIRLALVQFQRVYRSNSLHSKSLRKRDSLHREKMGDSFKMSFRASSASFTKCDRV